MDTPVAQQDKCYEYLFLMKVFKVLLILDSFVNK
jgi:hypothetical protein